MGILELPPEILDEIIILTLPENFECFAVCCRSIHVRATLQIERHNALKRQAEYAAGPIADRGKALRILHEISLDPLLASYIKVLNLRSLDAGGLNYDPLDTIGSDQDDFRIEAGAMEKIKDMVVRSEYFEKAGMDVEEWWGAMMKDDESTDSVEYGYSCTVISLLTQLSNLRSVQLPIAWRNTSFTSDANEADKQLTYFLDTLVESSNEGGGGNGPLGKLETILPFMPGGYNERAGLQCLEPFLSLKKLRELYAVSCIAVDDQYTGIPFEWRSTNSSSIRRIELASCCMDAEGLSMLVSHTPLLQVFKYSHETKWHGCQHDWNPGAFVATLAEHCGATIQDLAITIDELYGEIINGASTFMSFPNLRFLEVDVQIFCGPPIESGQSRGMNGNIPEGETPWAEDDLPCIGSMVPEGIVEVHINTDYPDPDEHALVALLKNVRQQRAERLTKLDKVIIRQYRGETARKLVETAGITLAVYGVEGDGLARAMMPAWKRQFEDRVGGIELEAL